MTGWLAQPLVPIAWCWRIERRDGVTMGFTTHDAPMLIDGVSYDPAPGIRPSAIHQRDGIDGDSFDISGALSSASITEADLASGRWDDALLTLMVVNWSAPAQAPIVIAEGRIGVVASDGRAFTAELAMHDPLLNLAQLPETSSTCRAELGDARCRVAMAPRTHRAQVVAADGDAVTLDRAFAGAMLSHGRLRWLSGAMAGLTMPVIAHDGAELTLGACAGRRLADSGVDPAGARVELSEGCDKRAATCAARFANIANFRGEPHLPGMDLLTRFPGGS